MKRINKANSIKGIIRRSYTFLSAKKLFTLIHSHGFKLL